jgi:gliding motility-associated-like protein
MNSPGYNRADSVLINAIINNGYTVVINDSIPNLLPTGFTSSCNDSINGYDWLCFFGDYDYSSLLPEIKAFIDAGGKVYYQYEVNCCDVSSASVATILSGLTGLPIVADTNVWIAMNLSGGAGYKATNFSGCDTFTVIGNAYKGLSGIPFGNQFIASYNIGSNPSITTCPNFGFNFSTTDFIGTANNGAILGIGDYNVWYYGNEPPASFGFSPLDTNLLNFIFPESNGSCSLYPRDCSISATQCKLKMPNVFTPNNDNFNNTFHPIEMECVEAPILSVYNRWGIKVFETNDLKTGWDGYKNGNPCSEGTYYWILDYTQSRNKENIRLNGFLSLIR